MKDLREADAIAAKIGDDEGWLNSWREVATAEDDLGEHDAARAAVRAMKGIAFGIAEESQRVQSLEDLVAAKSCLGDFDGAFATVEAVGEDNDVKGQLLGRIAMATAGFVPGYSRPKAFDAEGRRERRKVLERIATIAERFEFSDQRPYVELASTALANLGDFDEALGSRIGSARAR